MKQNYFRKKFILYSMAVAFTHSLLEVQLCKVKSNTDTMSAHAPRVFKTETTKHI
jgi:hypothetical protein